MRGVPPQIEADMRHAVRLECWTIGWQLSIVILLYFVLGSSQAMKSAWVEDALGLVPAIVFLISVRLECKPPNRRYPYGFHRVNSLAFLISATALALMGTYLLYDSAHKLIAQEHPTIGAVTLFGEKIWLGWLMIGALAYSVVPPVVLGRLKRPVAERLRDKVLHTDALMQKADWMTGLAAILGITGVGFGLWWADSLAAALIAFNITRDGYRALRTATAELVDGAPRALESTAISEEALALKAALEQRFAGADVRLRETGRYIAAEVRGVRMPETRPHLPDLWPGNPESAWRFAELSFLH